MGDGDGVGGVITPRHSGETTENLYRPLLELDRFFLFLSFFFLSRNECSRLALIRREMRRELLADRGFVFGFL